MKQRIVFITQAVTLVVILLGSDIYARLPVEQHVERVSITNEGGQGNDRSYSDLALSANGRYVVFLSNASNLVTGDTNDTVDVFIRDRRTGTTERVSLGYDGSEISCMGPCHLSPSLFFGPLAISVDGRYVAFVSNATNMVINDTNGTADVFVRDRLAGTTERVSVANGGGQGDDFSASPSISADGRYVAFASRASNLVDDDTNAGRDIFVRDRLAGTTKRVSIANDGEQGDNDSGSPSISADGRYVAFLSIAANLVTGDTNVEADAFVHDRLAQTTERVSVTSGGEQVERNWFEYSPSISADGRYIAFDSRASNLVAEDTNGTADVFVRDRLAGTTERVSVANGGGQGDDYSSSPSISADGRYIAFVSSASSLVAGDTSEWAGIFVRDRVAETTKRVSVATGGAPSDNGSVMPVISADGRFVAFESHASNLVADDTNETGDVFIYYETYVTPDPVLTPGPVLAPDSLLPGVHLLLLSDNS